MPVEILDECTAQLYSGRFVDPLRPDPGEIDILDIAQSLSMLCRYNGHVRDFFSVAQHSWIVSHLVPPRDALWGLLHDAAEAFLGDLWAPVKARMGLYEYRAAEEVCLQRIAEVCGLEWPPPPTVKAADVQARKIEKKYVLEHPDRPWEVDSVPWAPVAMSFEIRDLWTPDVARRAFLDRFAELTGDEGEE